MSRLLAGHAKALISQATLLERIDDGIQFSAGKTDHPYACLFECIFEGKADRTADQDIGTDAGELTDAAERLHAGQIDAFPVDLTPVNLMIDLTFIGDIDEQKPLGDVEDW